MSNSDILIEEFVRQHPSMSLLNSSSVNTVRIYTVLDRSEKSKNVKILSASLRVGGAGAEVDNYHAGGIGYPLDTESGIVIAPGRDICGKTHIFHPGSNTKVIGFEIPEWKKIISILSELANQISQTRLIAWDIAITVNGPELIEANVQGDPGFMQAPMSRGLKPDIMKAY